MRRLPYAIALAALCGAPPARAQDSADRVAAEGRSSTARDEAGRRFARGLELFNEADYTGALVEFRRAHALAPNFRVLYNIGQVCFQLQNYACALQSLDQYLSEGAQDVPSARRAAVEADIDKLRSRVGRLVVRTNVRGATVLIDDAVVGRAPLAEPIVVSAGVRKVSVAADGRASVVRSLSLAGEETATLELDFPELVRTKTDGAPPPPARTGMASWPFWVTGATLAAGATVTGISALNANNDLSRKRDTFGVTQGDLRSAERRASNFALATDIVGGLAAVSVGFALYAAFSGPPRVETPAASANAGEPAVRVSLGAGTLRIAGTF